MSPFHDQIFSRNDINFYFAYPLNAPKKGLQKVISLKLLCEGGILVWPCLFFGLSRCWFVCVLL